MNICTECGSIDRHARYCPQHIDRIRERNQAAHSERKREKLRTARAERIARQVLEDWNELPDRKMILPLIVDGISRALGEVGK